MKMTNVATIFCAAVVLAMPCVTDATPLGTVDIAHTGYGAVSAVKIWGGGYTGRKVYSGVYMFNKTDGSGQGDIWSDGPVGVFCIDLPQGTSGSTVTYDVTMPEEGPVPTDFLGGPMGAEKAEYLSELWGRFFDPSWAAGGSYTQQQKNAAAAFGVAIWEIVYEGLPASALGWDVTVDGTAGDLGFRCEGSITTAANEMLHALDGTGPKADLRALLNDGYQDYIIAVPEPSTVVMLGMTGLITLLHRRRK